MTGRIERLAANQAELRGLQQIRLSSDNTAESIVSYLNIILECLNIPQLLQSVHGLPICSDTRKNQA